MPQHADFDVPERDPDAAGPTFTLGGETFTCLPVLPAGAFMDLPETVAGQVVMAGTFITGCLVPDDEERFRAAIHDKSKLYEPVDLMPIVRWLLATAWTPTGPPEPPRLVPPPAEG